MDLILKPRSGGKNKIVQMHGCVFMDLPWVKAEVQILVIVSEFPCCYSTIKKMVYFFVFLEVDRSI